MRTLRFVGAEAWYEFRAGCRGPLIPIVFLGIIAYVMLVLTNADYLREYGSIDVQRNSPQLVYLMLSGQAMWVIFVWAWLFGQIVVRDRTARLHEVVLAAPISLPALLAGRFLGAVAVGCLLALSMVLAFLLVPLLGVLGVVPADALGPQPYFALGHSLLVFTLPSVFGLGALLLCAAIRTRGLAGPFAVAAALMLVWMVAMVVLRGGDPRVHAAGHARVGGDPRTRAGDRRRREGGRRGARRETARRSAGGRGRRRHGRGAARCARCFGRPRRTNRADAARRRDPLALARRRLGAGGRVHSRHAALRGRPRRPGRIGPVPTTVDPAAPFTLLDAWPSFERTPADNVWRGYDD